MPNGTGRYFHVEALVDDQALHDLLLGLDQLKVFNVQVRAVRPEAVSAPARRVALPLGGQDPATEHTPPRRLPQTRPRLPQPHRRRDFETIETRVIQFMDEHPAGTGVDTASMRARMPGEKPNSLHQTLYHMVKKGTLVRLQTALYARPQP